MGSSAGVPAGGARERFGEAMIDGIQLEVDPAAVVVRARAPLRVVSSAAVGGGFGEARAIINLHVPKDYPCADPAGDVARFCLGRGIPEPWVGLLTSAWTHEAQVSVESGHGVNALAVVTVGLSNRVAAGLTTRAAAPPSTINSIVVIDGDPGPAALVNAVITATEAKALALVAAGIRCADGQPSSGTSTDAVVIAATGRGLRLRFGGPISELGWVVARAVRAAVDAGIRRWLEEHP